MDIYFPYPAATIFAITAVSVASVLYPAVRAPSKKVPMAPCELSPPMPMITAEGAKKMTPIKQCKCYESTIGMHQCKLDRTKMKS